MRHCARRDCRGCEAVPGKHGTMYLCNVVVDTEPFLKHCPFYKTEEQFERERRDLARKGHRMYQKEARR